MIQIVLLRPNKDGTKQVHKHPKGFPAGLVVPNIDALFTNLGNLQEKLKAADPDNLRNVYFTVAHHAGLGEPLPTRTKISFAEQTVIAIDLDSVDSARAWEYLPVVAKILDVLPANLIFTATGNGLHIMAHLKTPIRSSKYIDETRPNYNELCFKIKKALELAGLPAIVDPSVWDAPRILRLPNTINDKKGALKEAKLLQYPGFVPLDLDIIKLSGLDKMAVEQVTPAQLKRNYPLPDFPYVMSHCEFLKWCAEKPEEVHEPHFILLIGLMAAMSPLDKIDYRGEDLTPKEFARAVHAAAVNSKSLQGSDFEQKWEHGLRYGAPKCQTVSNSWIGGCEKCPHFHKIPIALQLKSEAHISSAANGYWVMGQKNTPLHPHYSDLLKLYKREHAYFVSESDRIFAFQGTQYKETGPLLIKNWLDKKVGHEDFLREAHCMEFVKKVMRSETLPEETVMDFFTKSIRGKLNCSNGVVDILTGELLPHSMNFGFQYVLPYHFESGQVSEFFVEWLTEMMQNRTELMEAVLDMMAYCLWPAYDDHVFCYFVGEGANGKGTLIHILQALLGSQNYSAVSMQQLASNRFAPASLEGKLANVSEESSGSELSFEELNMIKDLSAGGEIQVERKGQQPFNLRNQAKLIFSANKTPRFREQGVAIRRRLLVIPFDYLIKNRDPRVEKRLLAEVPQICSMLVTRIQQNILANGGRFIVSRGGHTADDAQEKVLMGGNSVFEWAKECLESSVTLGEDKYIVVSESYPRYVAWCGLNGYKQVNSHTFGGLMVHGALGTAVTQTIVKKMGGKAIRVYPYTQWRQEE